MPRAQRKPPARTSRSSARRISYREASTEEENSESSDYENVPTRAPSKRRRRIPRAAAAAAPAPTTDRAVTRESTRTTRSRPATDAKRKQSHQHSKGVGRPRHANNSRPSVAPARHIPSDGVIPDWASLPYDTLYNIFFYASYPLRNDALQPTPARSWLCQTARVCRTFCEPALAALYFDPPLGALSEPFSLLDLVSRDQSQLAINYSTKVRRIELMARDTLMYTTPGRGLFDLAALIPHVPQLKEIYIKDHSDQPPFRVFGGPRLGQLQLSQIWDALQQGSIQLTGGRLNSSMMINDSGNLLHQLNVVSLPDAALSSLQNLRHLELARIQLQKSTDDVRGTPEPDASSDVSGELTSALQKLPALESLTLESCFHITWSFLVDLPKSLTAVKITNTAWLSSDAVIAFLTSHGSTLQSLDLSHNQYLDLEYLTELGQQCPNLRSLKMDARYFSAVALNKDSEPLYDNLLLAEDQPTWPAALVSLELTNLRKWELDAVRSFFGSLIRAAPNLPALRRIVIRAMVSIGWRDRAGFRDKYFGTLERIFKRHGPPPDPHLASFRAYRLSKEAESKRSALSSATGSVFVQGDAVVSGDSKGLRRSSRTKVSYAESDSDDADDAAARTSVDSDDEFADVPIQGMCEVVDVNIDNMRPAEVQFHEADFIDSELSGDEEWSESREREGHGNGTQYAW